MARDRIERARVYLEAVEIYEPQDVEVAVGNFLRGAAPGHNAAFVPPAPQVGAEVRRVMNLRLESEARDRARRPSLPRPDVERGPDSRRRVAALMEEHIASLAKRKLTEEAEADRRRRELLAETNARFAPDMSPEAQRDRLVRRHWYGIGDPDGAMD